MALREELDLTDWCDSIMLRELNDQRRDGHMCDVIICVDGKKIPAHRNVLAAASPFFRGMFGEGRFSEATKREVNLAVNKDAALAIINTIYTGELQNIGFEIISVEVV